MAVAGGDLGVGEAIDPVGTPDDYEQTWQEERPKVKAAAAAEAEEVITLGGLYVVGTERHDSRRIDNQLRGRSGRQGDPGETRFYLSLGDELMLRFNGAAVAKLLNKLRMPDDMPIEAKVVAREIQSAQTQVEQRNFQQRRNVLRFDEVMDQQRKVIYAARRRILEGENLKGHARRLLRDVISAYVAAATAERNAKNWDLDALWAALKTLYPVGLDRGMLANPDRKRLTRKGLLDVVLSDAERAYSVREAEVDAFAGEGAMRRLERSVVLDVIDRGWRNHLYEMDYLKEGIGLRAIAQRDPVVEYRREGYDMFVGMLEGAKEECVQRLFR